MNHAHEVPHLCAIIWEGGHVRNQQAKAARNLKRPKLTTLWAAGLSFSKCHAEREVPYDVVTEVRKVVEVPRKADVIEVRVPTPLKVTHAEGCGTPPTLTLQLKSNNMGVGYRITLMFELTSLGAILPSYDVETRLRNTASESMMGTCVLSLVTKLNNLPNEHGVGAHDGRVRPLTRP